MRIIPAIDIIDGKCVRLFQGDFLQKKIYSENPLEVAKKIEDHGIKYLHLIDLDGAKRKHVVNHKLLEQLSSLTKLKIDFGGGIHAKEDIDIAFECGATQVTVGSIAATNKVLFLEWLSLYSKKRIILGADCQIRKIAVHGWQEQTQLDVVDFITTYEKEGIESVICTDITTDGTLKGPSVHLYKEIITQTKDLKLIASGGVGCLDDLQKLKKIGCYGAIIGKAIYEGKITLKQLKGLC